MRRKDIESIENGLARKSNGDSKFLFVPSGSTLLNLACSDSIQGAFSTGTIVNIIGDKSAGKTLLTLTSLACVCQLEKFNEYKLIYDDVERASRFDLSKLFGKKMANRISPPFLRENEPVYSSSVADLWVHVHRLIKQGNPFIYVCDSYDALGTEDDESYVEELAKAMDKDESAKTGGGYKVKGPKILSSMFRQITAGLQKTNSLLIIISQVRENLNAGIYEKKLFRAGGRALGHYSTHEIWLKISGTERNDKYKRIIGHEILAEVTKNKITGKYRNVQFKVFDNYGVDDVDSCISFLVKEGFWKQSGSFIVPEGLYEEKFQRKKLIETIEEKNHEAKLSHLVAKKWKEIEDALKINRKERFE